MRSHDQTFSRVGGLKDAASQAREAGRALSQEVDSLSARMSGSSTSSISSAQSFSKEASILSDVSVSHDALQLLASMRSMVGVVKPSAVSDRL